MPYGEISMVKNFNSDGRKSVLYKNSIKILIESEGLKDNPVSRSMALLDIKEYDSLIIGGFLSTSKCSQNVGD